ncbi:MAG TPA: CBS domain-containing protein [Candidatus Manganitrophaceae bacterium]|nr:CBS domain-containing protein [Candidatus Manganitrophaceae bacterium]
MKPHFETVGEVKKTNTLSAREETPAYQVALALLESGLHGMPILDSKEKVVGKVTELDLLKALMEGKDLEKIPASEVMRGCPVIIEEGTPLEEVAKYMVALHLFRIPVVDAENHLVGSITRHDVLRGWLGGLGLTHEGFWG